MQSAQQCPIELNLDGVFQALEQPLALVDSPERRAELQRFISAARVHLERGIFDLLSAATTAVNAAGTNTHVRLEYESGHLYLAIDTDREDEPGPAFGMDGGIERVTLRLPARLKGLIDDAAAIRGVSVNSWYVRTLARALHHQMHGALPPEQAAPRAAWRGRRGRRGQLNAPPM